MVATYKSPKLQQSLEELKQIFVFPQKTELIVKIRKSNKKKSSHPISDAMKITSFCKRHDIHILDGVRGWPKTT